MTIILSTLTLLVGIMGLFEANHQKHSGELVWPHKSFYQMPNPVVSSWQQPPQDAGTSGTGYVPNGGTKP
jgi:hypothetical protein